VAASTPRLPAKATSSLEEALTWGSLTNKPLDKQYGFPGGCLAEATTSFVS